MESVPEDLPFTLQSMYTALEDVNGRCSLGLQMRVAELKTTGAGLRGEGLDGFRTEMQSHWLGNGQDHSWQEVGQAEEQAVIRSEEVHRREAKRKTEKDLEAVDHLEATLQELATSDRNVGLEQRKLEEELRERNESFTRKQEEWRREGEQWEQQSETRGKMLAAIGSGHYRELLREKGLPEEPNPVVECYLHKKFLDEEVKRSKQLISCHQQIEQHQRYLEYKLEEIRKLKVVEECMHKKTVDLLQSLEKVDMKQEIQQQLENLLEKLQQTLRSFESTLKDNDRALEDSNDYLRECNCDISEMLESLTLSLQGMEMSLSTVIECKMRVQEEIDEKLEIVRSTLIGGVGVAAGGAALGQILGPVGALAGAGIGALIGGIAGLASGTSEYKKKERESDKDLVTLEQEKSTYEKALQECQHTARCAEVLLQASTDRDLRLCSNPP